MIVEACTLPLECVGTPRVLTSSVPRLDFTKRVYAPITRHVNCGRVYVFVSYHVIITTGLPYLWWLEVLEHPIMMKCSCTTDKSGGCHVVFPRGREQRSDQQAITGWKVYQEGTGPQPTVQEAADT